MGLGSWGASLFRFSLLGLIAVAVLMARASPGSDASKLMAGILVLKRVESFVRLGLLGALFLFVVVLGLPWGHQALGIAAGFALYGAIELAALLLRSHYRRAAIGPGNGVALWPTFLRSSCGLCTCFAQHGTSKLQGDDFRVRQLSVN